MMNTQSEIATVEQVTNKRKSFSAKEIIYRQGVTANTVYVIRSGLVLLLRSLPNGRTKIASLHREADWIGLEGLINRPHQYTAVAVSDVEVCRISMKTFRPISYG